MRPLKTILLTGFEPFGGATVNPSQEIARRLDGRIIAGHRVVGAVLPCVFGGALAELKRQLRAVQPVVVIAVGQAGGRAEITPERVAINLNDARIQDNAGAQPTDRPVVRGGPAAYWSTLPVKAMAAELRTRGFPASVSHTAGTFVCNHVFYGLMHALRRRTSRAKGTGPVVRGGFIHVPWLPEQAGTGEPSLPLERMVAALTVAIEVAVTMRRDRRGAGGQIS